MYAHDGGCSRGGRIKRGILIGLFSIGTIGGFASGFHSMKHCKSGRQRFEDHVADVCVRAANRANDKAAEARGADKTPPPARGDASPATDAAK